MVQALRQRRPTLVVFSIILASALHGQDVVINPRSSTECITCPKIVVRGRLAGILAISDCNGASGMTCQIEFKRGAELPSRIVVQELDGNQPSGKKKYLPYPNLKAGEHGSASFPMVGSVTVLLTGEWNGGWQSSY
jgi:hypothetical protein